MSGSSTKLYSYWRSSCSWRVRAALALKNIPYEYAEVNLIKDGGQQHSDEYKRVNPAQLVPSLVIDGHVLGESIAIIEYLDETRPNPPLLPKDPVGRAKVRALSLQIVAGTQPLQNTSVLKRVGDEKKLDWAKYWISKGLEGLEALLAKTAGRYSYGDTVTVADLCLVPQIYNAIRFEIDLSPFPISKRIYDELLKLDAFRISHPSRQPDTPENEKATD